MKFRLVDKDWDKELVDAIEADASTLRIICPFIKCDTIKRIFGRIRPKEIEVITRFDCCGFYQGVSDLSALRFLLDRGASIRGVKNIHAKVYVIGSKHAIVTSANLTESALTRNAEFGFVAQDEGVIAACQNYFRTVWEMAGPNLIESKLSLYEKIVDGLRKNAGHPANRLSLPDFGADVGFTLNLSPAEVTLAKMPPQAFVKFWGRTNRPRGRLPGSTPVIKEVRHSGSYKFCSYSRRPRRVQDGAVIFMGRMAANPNDILIDGRAIAKRHQPGLDEATPEQKAERSWLDKYRYLLQVENPEFIAGIVENGVSLNDLMDQLGANSFRSTKRNAQRNIGGNTNPRKAYQRKGQVELSDEGYAWLTLRLEEAFKKYGKLSGTELVNQVESLPFPHEFTVTD
jgi:HKD family nuclease